jgi:competence protein ComEC
MPEFLAAAAPVDAAISCGRRNPFGHPRVEVLDEFAAARTRLYRTDTMGVATFLLSEDGGITAKSYATTPQ